MMPKSLLNDETFLQPSRANEALKILLNVLSNESGNLGLFHTVNPSTNY
jgi:hypothetical protein